MKHEQQGPSLRPEIGLLTDHYEMTMLEACLADGTARAGAVFELFTRSIPESRSFGVVAGIDRAMDAIVNFGFGPTELEFLERTGVVSAPTCEYLSRFKFAGSVRGIPEGGLFFGQTPILEVRGELAQCLILETVLLSILNFDSSVASAASRMVIASRGRPVIEMGSRRTHELAAVAGARAAYIAGCVATSNLEAGRSFGIPTVGTAAHSFILAHDSEEGAFRSQLAAQGRSSTYLVDTYDTEQGIRAAVAVVGTQLGAIRLDSGNPITESHRARQLLDSLGATSTRIIVSGDLDEFAIAGLKDAPIDGFGVGTRLINGSGFPTCNFVYKLVEIGDPPFARGVSKNSEGKASFAGAKKPLRGFDNDGKLCLEVLGCDAEDELDFEPTFGASRFTSIHRDLIP